MKTNDLIWKMENGRCLPAGKVGKMWCTLLMISFIAFPSAAQTMQVSWSAFNNGFGLSNSESSLITSSLGESFVGTSINGNSKIFSGFLSYPFSSVTDVPNEKNILPEIFDLQQNYPNPFNPSTIISWQLPVSSRVSLKVYDVLGNEVATLVNESKEAGYYEVKFDGSSLTSGMYIYRLTAVNYVSTKKMLMIK